MKYIVVTGVSTGIGFATAKELAKKGFHVFGSVRKQTDADRVSHEIKENFTPLIFDISQQDQVLAAAQQVKDIIGDQGLAGLVNNAGIALGGPMQHMPLDDLRWQLEVNVVGLTGVTQAFLPLLGAYRNCPHPAGKIINISSAAGIITSPFLGAYSASKHAVEALSHAFRRELQLYGVDVIIVGPGPIKTPIFEKFPEVEDSGFGDTDYVSSAKKFKDRAMSSLAKGLPAKDVGVLIYKIMVNNNPKSRYSILAGKFANFILPKILPNRLVDKAIGKGLGLEKLK